jgi:hypothetical protein
MKIKEIPGKIDKPALATAIGLMMMSWAALPFVYWLIIRKKEDKKEENGK